MPKEDCKHVVMFAAEAAPFVKVGGLADVAGALPKALEGSELQPLLPFIGHLFEGHIHNLADLLTNPIQITLSDFGFGGFLKVRSAIIINKA